MSLRQKRPRIKLDSEAYALLGNQVLERDGWRCQECGALENLQVHHLKPRSRLGDDAVTNLVTLCAVCHGKIHGR
jgi:5-methylcytosine-specific restriction endonuclease McrA